MANHQSVDKKIIPSLLFKLSYLNSNFALTLGYLNPSLNNPAQDSGFRFHKKKLPRILETGLPYIGRVRRVDSQADPIWQHYQFYNKLLQIIIHYTHFLSSHIG